MTTAHSPRISSPGSAAGGTPSRCITGRRSRRTPATEKTLNRSHWSHSGPPRCRAVSSPTRIAAKPKNTAKKPPGVTSSKISSPTPATNHIHQITVSVTLARGQVRERIGEHPGPRPAEPAPPTASSRTSPSPGPKATMPVDFSARAIRTHARQRTTWVELRGVSLPHGRPPHHDPAGPVLRPRRLPRRPVGAGSARGAHPRPLRPRPRGRAGRTSVRPRACPSSSHRLPGTVIEAWQYGERHTVGDVQLSFHPAGHVLGSAQLRTRRRRGRSGSSAATTSARLTRPAPRSSRSGPTSSSPRRPSDCPSSAGTPPGVVIEDLLAWWETNREAGRASLVFCHVLGKSQRLLAELALRTERRDLRPRRHRRDVRRVPGRRHPDCSPWTGWRTRRRERTSPASWCSPHHRAWNDLDAPLRRRGRRAGERLHAGPRRATPPQRGPRLRPLRPRRLAGLARRPSARPARPGCWSPTATPCRWRSGCGSWASRPRRWRRPYGRDQEERVAGEGDR